MDNALKSLKLSRGPLFRPWDQRENGSQSKSLQPLPPPSSQEPSSIKFKQNSGQSSTEYLRITSKDSTRQAVTNFSKSINAPQNGVVNAQSQAQNFLSLVNSQCHHFYQSPTSSKFSNNTNLTEYNQKNNFYSSYQITPDHANERFSAMPSNPSVTAAAAAATAAAAVAAASSGNMFGIPNLLAYNLSANLPHSFFPSVAANWPLDNLMTNKGLFASSTSSAASTLNASQLEKVIEQQHGLMVDRPAKKQRPKRFQCPHCQVSFSNNGQLKGHIRIHTGERPFVCDQPNCGKTFTRNEELTRHKRIHTGLRPFACSICNKRFGRKDHLKKHVKTHQRPTPIPMPLSLDPALSYAALAYSWL